MRANTTEIVSRLINRENADNTRFYFNPKTAIASGQISQILWHPRIVLCARRTTRCASTKSNARLLKAFAKSAQSQSRFSGSTVSTRKS
jgi:hypothetical protein